MKLKNYFMILVLVLSLSFISSTEIKADYKIINENVLVEINYDYVVDLELKIPYDAEALELSAQNYEITESGIYKTIKINSAKDLNIKYITKSLLDKSKKGYYFILDNQFLSNVNVTLHLPEGAVLIEGGIVSPDADLIITDGRRIILNWEEFNEGQIVVSYEFIEESLIVIYTIIVILIAAFIIFQVFQDRKFKKEILKVRKKSRPKKSRKKDLTKNLLEDEKKIVEYLLERKGKESWTKEIARGLDISKVKLSRKLKSLEKKEIIKKIPYGNENKIKLLK